MVVLETEDAYMLSLLDQNVSIHSIQQTLEQIGFEFEQEEHNLRVEITPDRIDALSTHGLARLLNAFLFNKKRHYATQTDDATNRYVVQVDSSVAQVRPYTACAVIKNVSITEDVLKELIWIQEKLHATLGKNRTKAAIGIYPMEKISWPIRYMAKKPKDIVFQPLESTKEMTAIQILEQHPTGKTYAHLLEKFNIYPIFIDAKDSILSMPPIINSEMCGRVTTKTKELFLECSGFDQHLVQRIADLLSCICLDMGFTVHPVSLESKDQTTITPQLHYRTKKITLSHIQQLLGITLTSAQASTLLEKMQYEVIEATEQVITVSVPPFRHDIWHDVDVIDDIMRAYDINKISTALPMVPTIANKLPINRLSDQLTDLLVGLGFSEIKTLAVTDKADQFDKMGIKASGQVMLGLTAESNINMVRTWLLPESLKTLANNKSAKRPQHIFEIGDVVLADNKQETLSKNVSKLVCLYCDDPATFTQIVAILESVFNSIGKKFSLVERTHESFIQGRVATIMLDSAKESTKEMAKNTKTEVGVIGELHPRVLRNWQLTFPVACFEIDLDLLLINSQPQQQSKNT